MKLKILEWLIRVMENRREWHKVRMVQMEEQIVRARSVREAYLRGEIR